MYSRDREDSFEPKIVKKHQTDISKLENSIIGMYAKGMSTRDISNQVNEMYGMDISPTLISNITDKIISYIKEWQCRPLYNIYSIIFMDAIHFKVRKDNSIINKAAYAAIGINLEGKKDVLGVSSRKCGFTTFSQYLYFGIDRVNPIDTPFKLR